MRIVKHIILLILGVIAYFNGIAQNIIVTDFTPDANDLTSRIEVRTDNNGKQSAVIKISSPEKIIKCEGNVIGDLTTINGTEYNVYLSEGSKRLDIIFEKSDKLSITFSDYGLDGVIAGYVYQVKLSDFISADEMVLQTKAGVYLSNKQYKPALAIAEPLADNGNELMQMLVLSLYCNVFKDSEKVTEIIGKYGNISPKSQCIVGLFYISENNVSSGVEWLQKSVESGRVEALDALTNLYSGNFVKLRECKDDKKAYYYASIGASKGYKEYQHKTACHLLGGIGVDKNESEAVHWLSLAASQGKVESQRMLGALYVQGIGGNAPDLESARRWLNMAASQGDEESRRLLNEINQQP